MKTVFQKIKSNQGSSMILALLLMLVAIMVSGIILAFAATSARNVGNRVDRQQGYLTVSSAATVFRDAILDTECTYKRTETHFFSDATFTNETGTPQIEVVPISGSFGKEIQRLVEDMIQLDSISCSRKYKILVDGFEPVWLTLELKKVDSTQLIRQNTAHHNRSMELDFWLDASFSNVEGDENSSESAANVTYSDSPVQMVVRLYGTMRRDSIYTSINGDNVLSDTFTLKWDQKKLEILRKAPEATGL